ncbi:hypothetical protein FDP41_001813 [Naegleria fowleri]|uniref:Repressor of RNA polymerase III transcription n=1 Tax=Naegleria fowleri TaxID=5763 RepID=A0A6A5C0U0_NAEFO|nr:uncharacterized protein FDP41_001813 [Naegleria fowleri]KAF0979470.1 hypothetical protein FDP41_001813 [Naegleria fowleri]
MKYMEFQELWPYNCLLDGYDLGCTYLYGKIEVYSCKQTSQDKKLTKEIESRRRNSSNASPATMPNNNISNGNHHLNNGNHSSSTHSPSSTTSPQTITVPSSKAIAISPKQQIDILSPPALSPPAFYDLTNQFNDDPFGEEKRQTFVDLIATLNNSFPDYDFRNVKPEFFVKLNLQDAIFTINNSLHDLYENEQFNSLWSTINEIIDLNHCEVYSYVPDQNLDDPFADPLSLGGSKLWTWNYFFVNRKLKRLVFFTAYGKSKASTLEDDEREGMMVGDQYDEEDYFYSNPKNANVHYQDYENDFDEEMVDDFEDV